MKFFGQWFIEDSLQFFFLTLLMLKSDLRWVHSFSVFLFFWGFPLFDLLKPFFCLTLALKFRRHQVLYEKLWNKNSFSLSFKLLFSWGFGVFCLKCLMFSKIFDHLEIVDWKVKLKRYNWSPIGNYSEIYENRSLFIQICFGKKKLWTSRNLEKVFEKNIRGKIEENMDGWRIFKLSQKRLEDVGPLRSLKILVNFLTEFIFLVLKKESMKNASSDFIQFPRIIGKEGFQTCLLIFNVKQ